MGSEHARFHLKSLEDLKSLMGELDAPLPISNDFSKFADKIKLGDIETPNRFVVHPMEGFDALPDGSPDELSFRRYRRYAEGGAGLIWFEATAVLHEARSNPGQLYIHDGNVDVFAKVVEATKSAGMKANGAEPVMVVQLTHSGRYSKPDGTPAPLIAHRSPILDPKHNLPEDYPVLTDDYLDALRDKFVEAAHLAAKAGFDGIDIKSCHRYLMSELLASHTREGRYGGSLENRTRLLRETLQGIADEVKGVFVTTRMSAYDAISYPYGWGVSEDDYMIPDLSEPLQLVGQLKDIGAPVINISIGNPYFNPHFGRPYDFPIKGMDVPKEHPLTGISRFVKITETIQKQYPDLAVIGSGYTWLRHLMPYVAAGVLENGGATLIGQGRGSFAYPDSVNDIIKDGEMDPQKVCVTCSACTQIMRDGGLTGCVVRDSEIYGAQYRLARRYSPDRLKAETERCRDCENPSCAQGCPAGINIPAFLKAFQNDDLQKAYDLLRERNPIPEMCAYVCPVEEQCQGHCIENIFCENPIAIADVQMAVSRMARKAGIAGVKMPEQESGRTVAIIGSGPAGLGCAVKLLEQGHKVTVFDKGETPGGVPDSIIPAYRYGEAGVEVSAIFEPAVESGRCEFKKGCALGADVSVESLKSEYDAVLVAIGLTESSTFGRVDGVYDALSFLKKAKGGEIKELSGPVAVLGAGNTAMDAALTAKKLGSQDVYVVYRRSFSEMPAWEKERQEVLAEGVHLLVLAQPKEYISEDGKLKGLKIVRTELGPADESGRRRPQELDGTESILDVEMIIEAMGQNMPEDVINALGDVKVSKWGTIEADEFTCETNVDGVYAAGDCVNGGTTAVKAIAEGVKAAAAINSKLEI